MKFPVQENVLRLQIMMQEGRVHVVEKVNPQGNLIQNPEAQRPAETRVDVFLQGWGGGGGVKGRYGSINNNLVIVCSVLRLEAEHMLGLVLTQ